MFAPASSERWAGVSLPSGSGAVMMPIVEAEGRYIGGCMFLHRNPTTAVLTVVRASAGSAAFCEAVGKEVVR